MSNTHPKDQPPKWAQRLLRMYCKPRVLEIIEGDIYELFEKRLQSHSRGYARKMFAWDVFRFFRLRYIKGFDQLNSKNNTAMFKNYFKVSIRSLMKHKFYSFINITGLSLGLAACLMITMYVTNELSYDKFHQDADQIYRMANNQRGRWTPARLGIQAKMDFPEIEEIVRLTGPFSQTFNIDGNIFREANGFRADSTFHKVFTVQFVEGNPDKALTEPNSVILSQSLASKLFSGSSAFGQLIKSSGRTIKVTGVIADPPKNTHFHYNFIYSFQHSRNVTIGDWTGNGFYTYAKVGKGVDVERLEAKFPDFRKKYAAQDVLDGSNYSSWEDYVAELSYLPTYSLKPMVDLHLYHPNFALGSNGDIDNVFTFSLVGAFILLIASINFMNLSTARSAARSKEVGMRKVLGSQRNNLISQFLIESMIVSIVAMFVALALSYVFLDGFNQLANRNFVVSDLFAPSTMIYLLALVLVVGLLAGSYPAFYLSGFKPIKALKGEVKSGSANAFLRKGLVSFQFAISIFLIISTTVVYSQLKFMSNQKLGFNAEQVLLIKNARRLGPKLESFKNTVLSNPTVTNYATSSNYLSGGIPDYGYATVEQNPRDYYFMNVFVSTGYHEAYDMKLLEGRLFSPDLVSDSSAVVINKSAADWLGWDEVIGRKVDRGSGLEFTIIGVVEDFHYASLKRDIEPMIMRYVSDEGWIDKSSGWWGANYISLKVVGDVKNTVDKVKTEWDQAVPDEPFDFTFLDESFAQLYEDEERFGTLFTTSASLAITIACLGLFALAAFTLERRFKEIAVRKVLGASTYKLTFLIVKDFTVLVLIGALIAIPAGFFAMDEWLNGFAYQMKISPIVLILPVMGVLIIAWLTVGFQSIKTALGNPVKALRSE